MNESALLAAFKARLVAQTWTGSSNVVFPTGCVHVVPRIAEVIQSALNTNRVPMALIETGPAESDPEHDEEPDLIRFTFDTALVVAIPGDVVGENAMMGANKSGGATASQGRGIVELAQEFYNAVGKLNALESITIQVRQKGEQGAIYKQPSMWIVYRIYSCEAWGTAT